MEYKTLMNLKTHKPTKQDMIRKLVRDETFKILNNKVLNNNTLEGHYYNLLYSLMFSQTLNFLYQVKEEIKEQQNVHFKSKIY